MANREITLQLPEALAKEAEAANLLRSDVFEDLLREEIRQRRLNNSLAPAVELSHRNDPALAETEILQHKCRHAELERRFQRLAEQWKSESAFYSSPTDAAMLPSYQQIIGMGESAIGLLLRQLEREPDHWFWALKAITGVDPVPESERGKVQAMSDAWLKWGRENGYIS